MNEQLVEFEDEMLEKVFIASYLLDFNISKASARCHIGTKKGIAILKRDHVQAAIEKNVNQISQKCMISAEECLNELGKIAFYKHPSVTDGVLSAEDLEDLDMSAINTIEQITDRKTGEVRFKIVPYDKIQALKELLSHMKPQNNSMPVFSEKELEGKSLQEISAAYSVLAEGNQ